MDTLGNIDNTALFSLSYGLFVLTAQLDGRDNGCIINTAAQVADSPKTISIAVNKNNLTHDMVLADGRFNACVLSTETPFRVFQHFGFQSGRSVDKFADCAAPVRTQNGLLYLPKFANAVLSGRVREAIDCGSHTLFVADLTQARRLSDAPSATYAYYFSSIKPKPAPAPKKTAGWVCKICGFVYDGDPLPADFICPICNHGASDFEPLA